MAQLWTEIQLTQVSSASVLTERTLPVMPLFPLPPSYLGQKHSIALVFLPYKLPQCSCY